MSYFSLPLHNNVAEPRLFSGSVFSQKNVPTSLEQQRLAQGSLPATKSDDKSDGE